MNDARSRALRLFIGAPMLGTLTLMGAAHLAKIASELGYATAAKWLFLPIWVMAMYFIMQPFYREK